MKKLFLLFTGILFLQVITTGQSLLWKISGKGIKEPCYLYGTIHIQDKRVFSYDSTVVNALNSCNAYAMELLADKIDREELQKQMLMKDQTLDKLMSKEDYELLSNVFKAKTGQPLMLFNKMKPFFVYSQLTQAGMASDMPEALDLHFLKLFRNAGKEAYGIEKLSDQLGAIDQMSLNDQVKMLLLSAKDTTTEEMNFDEMISTYLKADLPGMLEMMEDTTLPANFNQAFLIDRNKGMAKNIVKLCKAQSTFNAIGAAHLPGEKGVIALIRKQGYTVEPVPFKFLDAEKQ